ncbi:MAG: YdiU family protein [Eubacteriaceae bacterium]|nr:YdiU family protein [Eubacteriaceae bacterium]
MAENNIVKGWNLSNTYLSLPKIFYSNVTPAPVRAPNIALFNDSLADALGLNSDELNSEQGAAELCGNSLPPNSVPIAQAYAGHQFGYFTILGDGRAALLGEQTTPDGRVFDIQLKGSGKTPYSRGGDGKAALGPMLREYIVSEAMHALGIPTTRSLAVVTTGEPVFRDGILPGAVLTRVASSHIRVGTFEYAAYAATADELKTFADYTLARHYAGYEYFDNPYLYLLKETVSRQASLIAKWQSIGFIHGVMNTDNMAISGESIDYGPCAFMDEYNPDTVFSSIDIAGRYAYKNQPVAAKWNLGVFANTLIPILDEDESKASAIANDTVDEFDNLYHQNYMSIMRSKLGLFNQEKDDECLVFTLLDLMKKYVADYTNTFIALTFERNDNTDLFKSDEYKQWNIRWKERLNRQAETSIMSRTMMKNSNPAIIPRNHKVEEALSAAVDNKDYSQIKKFIDILANPYSHNASQSEYCALPQKSDVPYRTFCGT